MLDRFIKKTRNVSETYMSPMVQNSGLSSLQKQNLSEASKQGIKIYKVDNTPGQKEWFDLDLSTCDPKINRDHLLIGRNPCTKFGIDQVMGSKDIERTTLGLQTDKPTDRRTNRPTIAKQYAPLFKAGIKIIMVKFEITTNNKSIDRHLLCTRRIFFME